MVIKKKSRYIFSCCGAVNPCLHAHGHVVRVLLIKGQQQWSTGSPKEQRSSLDELMWGQEWLEHGQPAISYLQHQAELFEIWTMLTWKCYLLGILFFFLLIYLSFILQRQAVQSQGFLSVTLPGWIWFIWFLELSIASKNIPIHFEPGPNNPDKCYLSCFEFFKCPLPPCSCTPCCCHGNTMIIARIWHEVIATCWS